MSEATNIPVFGLENLIDPFPMYKSLRDTQPVYHVPEMNMFYVTRYDLVREVLKDTATYSSKFDQFLGAAATSGLGSLPEDTRTKLIAIQSEMIETPPTMLTLDEPEHTMYRSLVSKLFTVSEIKKSEDDVKEVIDRHADHFMNQSGTDFFKGFGFPVPLEIIATRLGIPEADRAFFYEGATEAASTLRMSPLTPEQTLHRAQVAVDLQKLLIRIAEERRIEPRNDMITILANSVLEGENRQLSHGEILSILNQFLVAGHETTTSAFGWGMLALCQNPELQEELRGDAAAIKVFVEEVLRIESPVQGLPRVVMKDTRLGETELPAGSFVMIRYGAANRDERQFENPDQVDIHRKKAGMQMAFGSGIHHCIGAPLARQELNLGFPALLDRISNIRVASGKTVPPAEPSMILRNLPELYLEFEKR